MLPILKFLIAALIAMPLWASVEDAILSPVCDNLPFSENFPNKAEAIAWMKKIANFDALSLEEKQALDTMNGSSLETNLYLRWKAGVYRFPTEKSRLEDGPSMTEYYKNWQTSDPERFQKITGTIRELQSVFKKTKLDRDLVVYRATRTPLGVELDSQVGTEFIDPGFAPTSLEKKFAMGWIRRLRQPRVVLKINLRKGMNSVPISGLKHHSTGEDMSQIEAEILTPGMKYEIVRKWEEEVQYLVPRPEKIVVQVFEVEIVEIIGLDK